MLNKQVYISISALDLSKYLVCDWYFKKLNKKYSENITLLYTDTDSLPVVIKSKDKYKDMAKMKDDYDYFDHPKGHPLHCNTNKKCLEK